MGFQQGLSGLNAAAKQLDVIGNNVANANTVGFKQSQAQFADVYANSLSGGGAAQIGIGTKLAGVEQQFTQGNITSSNNPLDIAINGGGFFRMSNNGAATYTRNGQFHVDNTGYIVNSAGLHLTGHPAVNGKVSKGVVEDIKIDIGGTSPSPTKAATVQLNLDSRKAINAAAFDATDSTTYDYSTSTGVFDSQGKEHSLQTYYKKSGVNTWDVYGTSSDVAVVPPAPSAAPTLLGPLVFDTSGTLVTPASPGFPVTYAIDPGPTNPLLFNLDFKGSSQYGSNSGVTAMVQDGFGDGNLAGFSAGADGVLVGRYTNGQTKDLGQIVLANFRNPNGLSSLGDNQWAETSTSGQSLLGAPDTGNLGVLQSSAVEDSNVDLTAELVNMITAQRIYQANAQTIKTQDQVMQTIVNLR